MKKEIEDIIEIVYKKKNYKFFIEKCKSNFKLPKELINYAQNTNCELIEFKELDEASKKWCFKFPKCSNGNFEVLYKTILIISKIGLFFNIQHEFSVKNMGVNCIEPTLDGYDSQPYTMEQILLYEAISKKLLDEGYIELSYSEMNEVVCDITYNYSKSIYGVQLTVENLIFHDYLNICE